VGVWEDEDKAGERVMGQLERRTEAISGDFNSQDIANTLWAFATMGTKPGDNMMGQLERRAEGIPGGVQAAGHCKYAGPSPLLFMIS
jgi:hypothetical protein